MYQIIVELAEIYKKNVYVESVKKYNYPTIVIPA
jgi:hypothetical protein